MLGFPLITRGVRKPGTRVDRIPKRLRRNNPRLWLPFRDLGSDSYVIDAVRGDICTVELESGYAIPFHGYRAVDGQLAAQNYDAAQNRWGAIQLPDNAISESLNFTVLFSGVHVTAGVTYGNTLLDFRTPDWTSLILNDNGITGYTPGIHIDTYASGGRFWGATDKWTPGDILDFAVSRLEDGSGEGIWRAALHNRTTGEVSTSQIENFTSNTWGPETGPSCWIGVHKDTGDFEHRGSIEEFVLLHRTMEVVELESWVQDPYGYWGEAVLGTLVPIVAGASGGAPQAATATGRQLPMGGYVLVPNETEGRQYPMVGILGNAAAAGQIVGSVTETVTLADTQTAIGHYLSTVADGLSTADVPGGLGAYLSSVADTSSASDQIIALINALGVVADTASHSDAIAALAAYLGTVADTGSLDDSVDAIAALLATVADTASLDDAIVGVTAATGAVADTTTFADALTAIAARLAATAGTVEYSDAVAALSALLASVADTVSLSDTISAVVSAIGARAVEDTLSTSDAVVGLAAKLSTTADTVSASDAIIGLVALIAAQSDTVTFNDAVIGSTTVIGQALDTLGLNDAVSALVLLRGIVSDAVNLTDAVAGVAAFTSIVADTLALTATVSYPFVGGFMTATVTLQSALAGAVAVQSAIDGGIEIN